MLLLSKFVHSKIGYKQNMPYRNTILPQKIYLYYTTYFHSQSTSQRYLDLFVSFAYTIKILYLTHLKIIFHLWLISCNIRINYRKQIYCYFFAYRKNSKHYASRMTLPFLCFHILLSFIIRMFGLIQ
jgi:hypothetical protein